MWEGARVEMMSNINMDSGSLVHHAQRCFGISMYAIGGGGVELGEAANAWNALAALWPGAVFSAGPVLCCIEHAMCSLNQLVSLLLFPTVLSHSTPGSAVSCGWSLGSIAAQIMAMWLPMCTAHVHATCVLEARNRRPFPLYVQQFLHAWYWGKRGSYGSESHEFQIYASRRELFLVGQVPPFALSYSNTIEVMSGLMRPDVMQSFFQEDVEVLERSEVYAHVGDFCCFTDSDHYLVGQLNAWDIAHCIRRLHGRRYDQDCF